MPIELFDAHSSGCEVGLLVGSAEGRYRGRLLVQSDGHLTWRGILLHTSRSATRSWPPTPKPDFVARAMRYRVGAHSHLLALFSPEQPGIICPVSDGFSNLDYIFWKASGVRYFCGVDLSSSGLPLYCYEDFGEFDGLAKVTFRM